ncbi:fimbrial protein [Providencia vermicola]|nr:fimbrial protein [Providencia sp. G1(2023)]MBC8652385.1 fimbrial protein [Providencia vermicola]
MDCGANLGSNVSLELNYMGNPVLFDEKALETSRAGIGIRLYNATDSTVIAPNDKKKLTMTNNGKLQIPLYSIPVKIAKPTTPIIEGKFTATATISINYP